MSAHAVNSFATTRWSLVVAAGRKSSPAAAAALADLCQRYWYPLYAFVGRTLGDLQEARDLTQEFFVRLLEKNTLAHADPQRGRFRTFLLAALKNFLKNEWRKAAAQKRGGGQVTLTLDFDAKDARFACEPAHAWTPERLYERQWVLTLLDQVLAELRAEYVATERGPLFEQLKTSLAGEPASASGAEIAHQLGMTEGAVKAAAFRLRQRYRELLRAAVAQTVATDEDIDDEIRGLFTALDNSRGGA